MGMFWMTVVFYGFRVDLHALSQIPADWQLEDSKGCFVFAPHTKHRSRSIDSIIEESDIVRQYVPIEEVAKAFCLTKEQLTPHEQEVQQLSDYLAAMSVPEERTRLGWWIVEYVGSTLESSSGVRQLWNFLPLH